jgi:predicted AlkP superfamily pyrophosphatase or phosphodiesterase
MIGLICRAYEQAGYKGKFNFILVSDHGQLDVSRSVNVNTFFADKGWYTLDENGKAIDWKVTAISCGFSAYVKVKDPTDEAFKKEVKAYLQHLVDEGIYGFGQVFDEYELEEQWHLKGDFQFMLETDGCTSFWDRYTHPFVDNKKDFSDYRKGNATHGFLPTKGPRPVFVAKGPAFKENYVGRGGCIIDIAPTVAKAMGIEFYPCDGEARVDLLK